MTEVVSPQLALPAAAVEELLHAFAKALRAHQLYLPNNPVYQSALETLRAGFRPIWEATDDLVLDVSESELRWEGAVIYSQTNRSESISWVLFKDGVRSISFKPGVEVDEIVGLLDVIHRARTLQAEDNDDLLTLLWEKDFQHIRYVFVDLSTDVGAMNLPAPTEVTAATTEPHYVTQAIEEEAAPRAGVVRTEDFDTTLYFLDESEIGYLRAEVEREYAQDLRRNVLAMLFDVLELQPYPTVRAELISIVESLLPYLLGAGDFSSVAYVLREVKVLLQRAREMLPEHRTALEELPGRLSQPEPLSQLLQSLDEAHTHPSPEELAELFGELRAEALPTLLSWMSRLTNERVKDILAVAVERLGLAHVPELVQAMESPEPTVVAEAVRLAGKLKLQQGVAGLGQALGHEDRSIRSAAVQALSEIGTAGALQQLERGLEDADREVRLATVRVLGQRRHKGALQKITAAVAGKSVKGADLTEKMAFFEAYGAMVGEQGVSILDGMLNGGGFLKKREDAETRACAAMALGRIGSAAARAALGKAKDVKEPLVRNAVNRALRSGSGGSA